MIVKQGNKYVVKSKEGKSFGEYETKEEAKKRLKQIEFFKYKEKHRK